MPINIVKVIITLDIESSLNILSNRKYFKNTPFIFISLWIHDDIWMIMNIFSRNFSSIKYFPLISVLFFHNTFKLIFFCFLIIITSI